MEFKIDTKDSFTIIMPVNDRIDAILAGALTKKCEEMRQSGSNNFIIDLKNCNAIDKNSIAGLASLHEECYGEGLSIVFTGLNKDVINTLKEDEADLLLNVAPSMQEAIDIISMEILERDLFSEE